MSWTYAHPHPAVTVDCVVFGVHDERLWLLLIERARPPFAGRWALPGGFVGPEEDLAEAARRELREETGIAPEYLEQLQTFGRPGRDPRERVITVAYYALVRRAAHPALAASDAADARWFPVEGLPPLAFDHDEIVRCALQRLRGKLTYRPIGFALLPEKFTLTQLQRLYEVVLQRPLDKRNFRRKITALGILQPLAERTEGSPHRQARLFRFDEEAYARLEAEGLEFSL